MKKLETEKKQELCLFYKTLPYFNLCGEGMKLNYQRVRNYIRTTKIAEIRKNEKDENYNNVVTDSSLNEFPRPVWMKIDLYKRIITGAIKKTVQNINSCISNYKSGNISSFEFKRASKRNALQILSFEDKSVPIEFKNSPCYYMKGRKLTKVVPDLTHGCEIVFDTLTQKCFLHVPFKYNPTPQASDNQVALNESLIVFDEGVRAFLTGYSPNSFVMEFGNDSKPLLELLARIDYFQSERDQLKKGSQIYRELSLKMRVLHRQLRNMVSDLHWKICKVLTSHFETVILPTFPVSQIAKAMGYNRKSKRLLYLYSHYAFKQKLKFKSKEHGLKLFFVSEEFTSQACGKCGNRYKERSKTYRCIKEECGVELDRDDNGAYNILLKTVIECTNPEQ